MGLLKRPLALIVVFSSAVAQTALGDSVLEAIQSQAPYMVPHTLGSKKAPKECTRGEDSILINPSKVQCKSGVECELDLNGEGKIVLVLNGLEAPPLGPQFVSAQKFAENFLMNSKVLVNAVAVDGDKTVGEACVDGRHLRTELLKKGLASVSRSQHKWSPQKEVSVEKTSETSVLIKDASLTKKEADLESLFESERVAKDNKAGIWAHDTQPEKGQRLKNFPLVK